MKRFFAGIVLIPIVVALVLYTSLFWLTLVITLITLLALNEYNAICGKLKGEQTQEIYNFKTKRDLFVLVFGGGLPLLFLYLSGVATLPFLTFFLALLFLLGLFTSKNTEAIFEVIKNAIFGIVLIALPLSHLVLIGGEEKGRLWILLVLVVVWSADTTAYCVGRIIGRSKLCPSVSPGKTIEGAIGGIIGAVLAVLIFDYFTFLGLGSVFAVALGFVLALLSIIGDLIESVLKRSAGVKDSGTLIPGHGGVLDRIDSLFFVVPATYFFMTFVLVLRQAN
ncbi:MAG: phosphatidate cytidylyltransferase [Deltaproteobacteria bacterium]|nr:phosphatidate cytidylyltransferase [Deltaproteobacteria bacterium]